MLLITAFMALPSFSALAQPLQGIPPTQGAQDGITAVLSDLKILGGSQGLAMVTYMASAELSSGVSFVTGARSDSGLVDGSLLIKVVEGSCSIESIIIGSEEDSPSMLSWKAFSKDGGLVVFHITYLTRSISWAVSGHINAQASMSLDAQLFLNIRNRSSVDFTDAEFLLFGPGGSLPSAQGLVTGVDIWKAIKPVGQSIDLAGNSELQLLVAQLDSVPYRVFVGGSIGSGLKGYMGKQAVKEQIKLDIFMETSPSTALMDLPSSTIKMAVYLQDEQNGMVPAKTVDSANIAVSGGKILVKLDSSAEITAEIEKTESKTVGTSSYEESFRIIVRSSSASATEIQLIESFPGDWELINNTGADWQRKEGNTAVIRLIVPAKGTVTQMYKVRYTYSK